jgi:hypothetical protein
MRSITGFSLASRWLAPKATAEDEQLGAGKSGLRLSCLSWLLARPA